MTTVSTIVLPTLPVVNNTMDNDGVGVPFDVYFHWGVALTAVSGMSGKADLAIKGELAVINVYQSSAGYHRTPVQPLNSPSSVAALNGSVSATNHTFVWPSAVTGDCDIVWSDSVHFTVPPGSNATFSGVIHYGSFAVDSGWSPVSFTLVPFTFMKLSDSSALTEAEAFGGLKAPINFAG